MAVGHGLSRKKSADGGAADGGAADGKTCGLWERRRVSGSVSGFDDGTGVAPGPVDGVVDTAILEAVRSGDGQSEHGYFYVCTGSIYFFGFE